MLWGIIKRDWPQHRVFGRPLDKYFPSYSDSVVANANRELLLLAHISVWNQGPCCSDCHILILDNTWVLNLVRVSPWKMKVQPLARYVPEAYSHLLYPVSKEIYGEYEA